MNLPLSQCDDPGCEARLEALRQIQQWCKEYLDEQFPDQDLRRANEVLGAHGISMSAMHGQWARHIVQGILAIVNRPVPDEEEE